MRYREQLWDRIEFSFGGYLFGGMGLVTGALVIQLAGWALGRGSFLEAMAVFGLCVGLFAAAGIAWFGIWAIFVWFDRHRDGGGCRCSACRRFERSVAAWKARQVG